ncbi:MAG: alpha-galactosidase [Janthinobacterium lividum]
MKKILFLAAFALTALLCGPPLQCLSSTTEQAAVRTWATAALLKPQSTAASPTLGLHLLHQEYGTLGIRQSVLNTPLQIGTQHYVQGLGTHATSEILVRLAQPVQQFTADVGIDNNHDTAGIHGSVIFAVLSGGKELYRSGICRGGDAPVPVRVALHGARELTLRVLDDGDGLAYDQSDWADASVQTGSGEHVFLDSLPLDAGPPGFAPDIPFSFSYDGKPSAGLLPHWKRIQTNFPSQGGRERHVVVYTDPVTGLEVRCEATLFQDSPAVDWVLSFRNTGLSDTPLIEAIHPLNLKLNVPDGKTILHYVRGSSCAPNDFQPIDQPLRATDQASLSGGSGRSSDGTLPFFNLEWPGGGLAYAVGWSGQWDMHVVRGSAQAAGAEGLTLQAGQQTAHFVLHPGERIRTPRILLVAWHGNDRFRGHNLLRRLLLAQYVPREAGQIAIPPVSNNTWFSYSDGNGVTEANQLTTIQALAPLGVECYWLDAGWFEGGWPSGAGSWVPRTDAFPRGLKPLGDASHKSGMKFILWFEPERVSPGSRIAKEHPEWVLHSGGGDGLFNLGDPAACAWMSNLLTKVMNDGGVDIFRCDFNIDPLRFWQAADTPTRQGLTEAHYIEGLYSLWDDLKKRHPGLLIDNCASGGRRIDLETTSRSYPLWRSDVGGEGKPPPVWQQVQTGGLSLFVPLSSTSLWSFDPYTVRSGATTGTDLCMNVMAPDFSADDARRAIAEIKRLRPLSLGDYYSLTEINLDETQWCAWQFDRPELGQGYAVFFRRAQSQSASMTAGLHGLDPKASYEVTFVDAGTKQKMTGADLMHGLHAAIPVMPGSALVMYRKIVPAAGH